MNFCLSAIGEDSHAFLPQGDAKPLVLGGVTIPGMPGLAGNSDADVILHAVCNALSGLSGKPVLGARADALCAAGEKDSQAYLELALADLQTLSRPFHLLHLSLSVEARRPRIEPYREAICTRLATLLGLPPDAVCLTATSGEGLSAFGRGEGIRATAMISAWRETEAGEAAF